MNERSQQGALAAETLGEGFAFFHWVIAGYKTGRCKPADAGWKCFYCRGDWKAAKR